MVQLAPCRYCGAETEMRQVAEGVVQILNPDGSLHHCHEAERAEAIPVIFRGQVEDACAPLSADGVLGELQNLYRWAQVSICDFKDEELYALNAAIEVLKLVSKVKV